MGLLTYSLYALSFLHALPSLHEVHVSVVAQYVTVLLCIRALYLYVVELHVDQAR